MNIDGASPVFYGEDFITVIKAADANWAHIKPEAIALITKAIETEEGITDFDFDFAENESEAGTEDSLSYNGNDSNVVGMTKGFLSTRMRLPAQQMGGDIEFRGFEGGQVLMKFLGACRTCDSSTVTMKDGIEVMLMEFVSIFVGIKMSWVTNIDPSLREK
jgi:Fe-S cluster biogenesis protein NfuA